MNEFLILSLSSLSKGGYPSGMTSSVEVAPVYNYNGDYGSPVRSAIYLFFSICLVFCKSERLSVSFFLLCRTDDTQPNPYLYSSTEERYKPATCLRLWKHEREGRVRINGTLPSATGGAKEGEKKQSAQEEEKKFPFSSSFLQQQQEVRGNCACVLSSETSLVLPSAPLSSSSPPPPLALP